MIYTGILQHETSTCRNENKQVTTLSEACSNDPGTLVSQEIICVHRRKMAIYQRKIAFSIIKFALCVNFECADLKSLHPPN